MVAEAVDPEHVASYLKEATESTFNKLEWFFVSEAQIDKVGLDQISIEACIIAKQLATQRAIFKLEKINLSDEAIILPFDTSTMEARQAIGDGPSRITLMVAPGLRKYGTSDGTKFSESTLLAKMDVHAVAMPGRRSTLQKISKSLK